MSSQNEAGEAPRHDHIETQHLIRALHICSFILAFSRPNALYMAEFGLGIIIPLGKGPTLD